MNRRQARRVALQALYQMDVAKSSLDEAIAFAMEGAGNTAEGTDFARELAGGAYFLICELDPVIKPTLKGWLMERLPRVDLDILRMALYEMITSVTPKSVIINEAVELAKEFSTDDSGRFVNGVLATLAKNLEEPPVT
jgi:N utilization substance protein B